MSKLSTALIWPLFFLLIMSKVADITIANLESARNYLSYLIILIILPIALIYINTISIDYFKRIAVFFFLPIFALILSGELRALSSLLILLLLLPLYNVFLQEFSFKKFLIINIAVVFVIIFDLSQSEYFGVYSWGYYGRDRLFLGIFHPKDQAYLIIYLLLLSYSIIKKNLIALISLYSISFIAVYYTDSRGALVGLLLYGIVSIFGRPSLKYLLLILFLIIVYLNNNYSFDEINALSSNRISIWLDILNQNINPAYSIDSSFIFFGYRGNFGLFIIIIWILYSFFISFNFFKNRLNYFILIISLGIFDLGLFSFSNLVGLHCWTMCFFNEKYKS